MAKKQNQEPVETKSDIVPVFENSCEFKLISKVSQSR